MSSSRIPLVLPFHEEDFPHFHTLPSSRKNKNPEDSSELHRLMGKLKPSWQLWMGYSSGSTARRPHIRPDVQNNHEKVKIRPNTYTSNEWAQKDLMNEKYAYCELTFDFHCLGNKADLLVTMQPRKMGTEQACVTPKKGLSQLLLSILWAVCCLLPGNVSWFKTVLLPRNKWSLNYSFLKIGLRNLKRKETSYNLDIPWHTHKTTKPNQNKKTQLNTRSNTCAKRDKWTTSGKILQGLRILQEFILGTGNHFQIPNSIIRTWYKIKDGNQFSQNSQNENLRHFIIHKSYLF